MSGPVAQSRKIRELFNRERIDPSGTKILAFAMLYELGVAPYAWVGPGPDPFAARGESPETRSARYYASRIIPVYKPRFIPAHLNVDLDSAIASREFRYGESFDAGYVNQTLAVMLAALLPDQDLSNCSALSLIGQSRTLGHTRFAIVVGGAPEPIDEETRSRKSPSVPKPKSPAPQAGKTIETDAPPSDMIEGWAAETKEAEVREDNLLWIGCGTIIMGGVGTGLVF